MKRYSSQYSSSNKADCVFHNCEVEVHTINLLTKYLCAVDPGDVQVIAKVYGQGGIKILPDGRSVYPLDGNLNNYVECDE